MILAEIEKSFIITAASCWRTPVWRFAVYETGAFFPWFGSGVLGRNILKTGGVIINNISYTNRTSITSPEAAAALPQNSFCQIDNMVYVHNAGGLPLWLYYLPKYGVITGFTDGAPRVWNGVLYRSGLDWMPDISDKADSLEYGAMAFRSDTVELPNASGVYDDTVDYFGNNLRVRAEIRGEIRDLYEYYIRNVKVRAEKTSFICGDRREKLSQKIPGARFTREEYPRIKKELAGELKQDVYGACEWIKCVCTDEMDVYAEEEAGDGDPPLKEYRSFYAARKITALRLSDDRPNHNGEMKESHVWIKQTQGPAADDEARPEPGERWTPCPVRSIDHEKGEFTVDIKYCMPPWTGHDVPEVWEVRACGVFWTPEGGTEARPLDIIKELLGHYCGIIL